MIKLIATDLDGTLFNREDSPQIIEKENIELLREFKSKGGLIAITTGRGPNYVKWVNDTLGFKCYDVSLNGAINCVKDTAKTIPCEVVTRILKSLKQYNKSFTLLICAKDGKIFALRNKFFFHSYKFLRRRQKLHVNKIGKITFNNRKIKQIVNNSLTCKILIYFKNQDDHKNFKSIIEKEKKNLSMYTHSQYYEMNGLNCDKGQALQNLVANLGVSDEEVLVIGDGKNDIPMLKLYPNSFSFEYADKEVRKNAKYIIKSFNEIKNYLK